MEELETLASASDRHPAVTKGQEDLAGVKSVEIHRNIKKNSEDEYVVSQSTRTEMVYESAEKARDAYLNIYNAKEEAEFEDTEEYMDKIDAPEKEEAKPEIGSMTEDEEKSAFDARKKASQEAPITKQAEEAQELYCVMLTNGVSMVDSAYFDSMDLAQEAFNREKARVDAGEADRICLLQNNRKDPTDTKILQAFDRETGEIQTFNAWASELAKTAAPYVPGTAGVSDTPNPGPVSMGYSAKNQKGLENYTKWNGQVTPEHTHMTNKPFAYDEKEQMTTAAEAPNALLQRDFPVSTMENELKMGVNREHEHTDDPAAATEIALDHLAEDQNYYTKLNQVMPEHGKEEKKERVVYVHPRDKEVQDFDYEGVGKDVMFPGMK